MALTALGHCRLACSLSMGHGSNHPGSDDLWSLRERAIAPSSLAMSCIRCFAALLTGMASRFWRQYLLIQGGRPNVGDVGICVW